jgi:hypothetical protein
MSTMPAGRQGNKNQYLGEKRMVAGSRLKTFRSHLLFAAACSLIVLQGCEKPQTSAPVTSQQTKPVTASVSRIEVQSAARGPLVIKTPTAEFEVTPRGYTKAFLLHSGLRLRLDDPTVDAAGGGVTVAGTPIRDFILDLKKAVVIDATGKLGNLGKRVDIAGHRAPGLEETLSGEVYDDFPGMALVTASYRNPGTKDLALDRVSTQEHRINASLADAGAVPHDLWSFQGASFTWGQDEPYGPTRSRYSEKAGLCRNRITSLIVLLGAVGAMSSMSLPRKCLAPFLN